MRCTSARFYLISTLCFVAGIVHAADAGTAYVIPFKVETEVAITRTDLAKSVRERCVLSSVGAINDIVASSSATTRKFDESSVRVKVVEGPKAIFVDNHGVLDSPQGLAISERKLRRVLLRYADQLTCSLGHPRF